MTEIEDINLWFESQSKEMLTANGIVESHVCFGNPTRTDYSLQYQNEYCGFKIINDIYFAVFRGFI